jgi:hypothetical protein
MAIKSDYLNKRELKGLLKLGDVIIPRNKEFPSFSELGCIEYVDEAVGNLDPYDRNDLKLFLKVASILPKFMIKFVMILINRPFMTLLRMGNIGIKGIIYSLYYSGNQGNNYQGKSIFEIINYNVNIIR